MGAKGARRLRAGGGWLGWRRAASGHDRAGASSYAIFRALLREEGPRAFMKGWTASYTRIGPHTIISFVLIERARQFVGLQTY